MLESFLSQVARVGALIARGTIAIGGSHDPGDAGELGIRAKGELLVGILETEGTIHEGNAIVDGDNSIDGRVISQVLFSGDRLNGFGYVEEVLLVDAHWKWF